MIININTSRQLDRSILTPLRWVSYDHPQISLIFDVSLNGASDVIQWRLTRYPRSGQIDTAYGCIGVMSVDFHVTQT